MRRSVAVLACFFALLAGSAYAGNGLIEYPVYPASDVRPPDECVQWFHGECRNWKLAEWLPSLLDGLSPWRHHKATTIAFTDRFLYKPSRETGLLTSQGGPADGTPFVYGKAGPPKGTVVYDYANAIAFYAQGCCAWGTAVLAAGADAPPIPVVHRTLINLRTAHGIAIGESIQRVQALYGKATPQPVPGQPGMLLLSYTHDMNKMCGQFQNFVFQHDRLIYIELLNAC